MDDHSYYGCCNVYSYYDYTYQSVACEASTYYDCGESLYYGYTGCYASNTCLEKCPSGAAYCESGGGDAGGDDSSLWYIYLIVAIVLIVIVAFAVLRKKKKDKLIENLQRNVSNLEQERNRD